MNVKKNLRITGFLIAGFAMMASFQNCSQPGQIEFTNLSKLNAGEGPADVSQIDSPSIEVPPMVEEPVAGGIELPELPEVSIEAGAEAGSGSGSTEVAETPATESNQESEVPPMCPAIEDTHLYAKSFDVACEKADGSIGICTVDIVGQALGKHGAFVKIRSQEDLKLPRLPELREFQMSLGGSMDVKVRNKVVELKLSDDSVISMRLPGLKKKMLAGKEYKIKLELKHEIKHTENGCKVVTTHSGGSCKKHKHHDGECKKDKKDSRKESCDDDQEENDRKSGGDESDEDSHEEHHDDIGHHHDNGDDKKSSDAKKSKGRK